MTPRRSDEPAQEIHVSGEVGDAPGKLGIVKHPRWRPNPDAIEFNGPKAEVYTVVLRQKGKRAPVRQGGDFEDEVPESHDASIRIRPVGDGFTWPREP